MYLYINTHKQQQQQNAEKPVKIESLGSGIQILI